MAEFDEADWHVATGVSQRFEIYTRAVAADSLPGAVAPMTATLTWLPGVLEGWRDGFVDSGAFEMSELTGEGINPVAAFIAGYMYTNLSMVRLLGARSGAGVEEAEAVLVGHRPGAPPDVGAPLDVDEAARERIESRLDSINASKQLPSLDANVQLANQLREERPRLAELSDADLVARARAMTPHLRSMVGDLVSAGALVPLVFHRLRTVAPDRVLQMTALGGKAEATHPAASLWRLSRTEEGSDDYVDQLLDFLSAYGARGPSPWDPLADSFETDPSLVRTLIEEMRSVPVERAPSARLARVIDAREHATMAALGTVRGDDEATATIVSMQAMAMRLQHWREQARANCYRVINEQRVALHELGRRHVDIPYELAMVRAEELDGFVAAPGAMAAEVSVRRERWSELADRQPPFYVDAHAPLPTVDDLPVRAPGDLADWAIDDGEMVGGPGAMGIAVGTARVVTDPADVPEFDLGDVVVAEHTDGTWVRLLLVAGAVVCGHIDSTGHAAVVSRELGIPCVIGLPGCTERIPDGEQVRVDGTAGTVALR